MARLSVIPGLGTKSKMMPMVFTPVLGLTIDYPEPGWPSKAFGEKFVKIRSDRVGFPVKCREIA